MKRGRVYFSIAGVQSIQTGGTGYEPGQIGQLDHQRPCLLLYRVQVLASGLDVPSLIGCTRSIWTIQQIYRFLGSLSFLNESPGGALVICIFSKFPSWLMVSDLRKNMA